MARRYFENFPNINYDGVLMKDITRRIIIRPTETTAPFEFYTYTAEDHLRADQVAHFYYENAEMDWLIYLSNDILDPYYGWYNDDHHFVTMIEEKYGSIIKATNRVKFYRNNWAVDRNRITKSYYENTLAKSHRKYYEPIFGPSLTVAEYQRKQDDTVMNTNQIVQYNISANNNGIALEVGELVDIKLTGIDARHASAEVETANSTILRVKNVSGNTFANTSYVLDIIGDDTSANVSVNGMEIWFENIPTTDFDFFEAVSYLDWETEENEKKKFLNIIGDQTAPLFTSEFESLMQRDLDANTGLSTG